MHLSTRQNLLRAALTHASELARYLRRQIRNGADAQDLMQELYLKVLKIPASCEVTHARAYLFAMAGNLAWQYRKRRKAEPHRVSLEDMPGRALNAGHRDLEGNAPEAQALLAERLHGVAQRLSGLPPQVQNAVLWHHREGYTCDEVAERLNLSTACAKKYLVRGLAHCREQAT